MNKPKLLLIVSKSSPYGESVVVKELEFDTINAAEVAYENISKELIYDFQLIKLYDAHL